MADLHPDQDLLLDLALSDIDQQQRDALTGHLALCDPCRAEYAAIADSVDHVLAAAPGVAPPTGFSRSVLTAMGMTEPDGRASADDEARPSALPVPPKPSGVAAVGPGFSWPHWPPSLPCSRVWLGGWP